MMNMCKYLLCGNADGLAIINWSMSFHVLSIYIHIYVPNMSTLTYFQYKNVGNIPAVNTTSSEPERTSSFNFSTSFGLML